MRIRSAGLVLHPTSLPGPFGIGDLGPRAEEFVDWASTAGQAVWQVLPLGPTGYGNSPYGCLSAFGGNPLLVSPERLIEEGWLSAEIARFPGSPANRVEFETVAPWKRTLLRSSWERFRTSASREARHALEAFVAAPEQACWLEDWALFSALKEAHGGSEWTSWEAPLARRQPSALEAARASLAAEIAFHEYEQFLFFSQWERLKSRANRSGIRIMGDVPFYVAFDSADVWANARLFKLDAERRPLSVAGVPPDYFSTDGQLWGNPVYRWDVMEKEGFAWWIERLRANLRLADFVRLDHFRAFAAFWEVPATERTAVHGVWSEGPGRRLFTAVRRALGDVPVVAEDLGHITPDVIDLRAKLGIPGMKVLQFAFGEPESEHRPERAERDDVLYTGTHDNDTTRGWFASLPDADRRKVIDGLRGRAQGDDGPPAGDGGKASAPRSGETAGGRSARDGEIAGGSADAAGGGAVRGRDGRPGPDRADASPGSTTGIEWEMIAAAYHTRAWLAVAPVQDVIGLGSEGRMNTPGRESGNWEWRMRDGALTPETAQRLRALVEAAGRLPG